MHFLKVFLVDELQKSVKGIKSEKTWLRSGANPRGGCLRQTWRAVCGEPGTQLVQIGIGSQRSQKDAKKEAICFEMGQLRSRKILVM